MSWTLVNNAENGGGGAAGSVAVTLTGTPVAVGDVVVIAAGAASTVSVSSFSDGTTTVSAGPNLRANNALATINCQAAFFVSAISGTPTYTATYSASASVRECHVWIFRPSATSAFETDQNGFAVGTSFTSGNATVAGTDNVNVCFAYNEGAGSVTSPQINGVAATASMSPGGDMSSWYRITSAGFTGAGTCTGPNGRWAANLLSIQIASTVTVPRRITAPISSVYF
jgi:hypothetical protein